MSADNDPIEVTLQRLGDSRMFALAWGMEMDMDAVARDFLVTDSVMHYAASARGLALP